MEDQRAQGRVAARAAAADTEPPAIHLALVRQVARRADAVLRIDDAPEAVEPLAVRAPEAAAATVVDVDDAKAAAGPELDRSTLSCAWVMAVGPPWLTTISGGRSPDGPTKSALVGG